MMVLPSLTLALPIIWVFSQVWTGRDDECLQVVGIRATGLGSGQADAAPKVRLACRLRPRPTPVPAIKLDRFNAETKTTLILRWIAA